MELCDLRLALTILLVSAAPLAACPAAAQNSPAADAPPIATTAGDKRVYTPADFVRFEPRTAFDMLRQVPGFSIREADNDRGLGQASENVLINGQPVANKSGGATAELQKMSAAQVERIEIVEGASLDIPGISGQVANVVTKAQSKGSGQFSWEPGFAAHFADPYFLRGNIAYSGRAGRVGYTLGFDSIGFSGGDGGTAFIRDMAGQLVETRQEISHFRGYAPQATARITLNGPGSILGGANLSYQYERNRDGVVSDRLRVDGTTGNRTSLGRAKEWDLEGGGDLSFKFLKGRLKLIGLFEIEKSPHVSTGVSTAGNGSMTGEKLVGDRREQEWVARAEYGWKQDGADLQLSGEAAFNSLHGTARLFLLDPSGVFVETPFPGGSGEVKESRYEILGSYGRPIAPGISMQIVVGGEHSTLSARGISRRFLRYKGSASFAWQATANTDISFKLARSVGQLDFGDFLSSVDLTDQRQNIGNVNLVPPQSWEADLELKHKLGGWGTTRLRLYGQLIDDIVDTIPIGIREEALGNIDRATRHGVEWQTTLLLDPMGWKGVRFDATLHLERSRVRDPLTGEQRAISSNMLRQININFRHDIAGSNWAWGGFLGYGRSARNVQLTEISRDWNGPLFLNAFIENKDVFGLTVRAAVDNIADERNRRERIVFNGWRTDPVLFTESRNRLIGPTFRFSVRGNF